MLYYYYFKFTDKYVKLSLIRNTEVKCDDNSSDKILS